MRCYHDVTFCSIFWRQCRTVGRGICAGWAGHSLHLWGELTSGGMLDFFIKLFFLLKLVIVVYYQKFRKYRNKKIVIVHYLETSSKILNVLFSKKLHVCMCVLCWSFFFFCLKLLPKHVLVSLIFFVIILFIYYPSNESEFASLFVSLLLDI